MDFSACLYFQEHELADAEKAINLEELKREIAQLERERRQLEAQMNELKYVLINLFV